ncbi:MULTISPECIES: YjaG family protein [Corallincola]|uniref:DUF416 family protein n=3 Tax=Corallincola TaxID=1775176 RepID=A0A368NLI6_9GAMM|nr:MULTISPECIES: YjaG family protein [Corallincola]RCU50980.1 DUF416 family protein [Corallincola holothuriorum]TAA45934.1 DUF416 family protein [Corallincola spongiicola]TCI04042.1 DUF416 family protein [Corallincola luteus]
MASTAQLNQQLRELTPWQQLAFSACLSERMLPNYLLFSHAVEWGDGNILRNSMNAVWDALRSKTTQFNHERWQEKLADQIPDPQQFDMYGVWPALDATTALDTLFCQFAEPSSPAVVEISRLSRHTVKQYIQLSEGEEVDLKNHPLMQFEFEYQGELAEWLSDRAPTQKTIAALREAFLTPLESNLGLSQEE